MFGVGLDEKSSVGIVAVTKQCVHLGIGCMDPLLDQSMLLTPFVQSLLLFPSFCCCCCLCLYFLECDIYCHWFL